MALDLPPELEPVLALLGIEWPQVDEDEVTRFADELSKLASALDSVQMSADKAVSTLREAYHGSSADQFAELWTGISTFSGLVVEVCGTLATALHAGALVISAAKAASIAQLVTTQGELVAAAPTGPVGEAMVIAIGQQLLAALLDQASTALGQALAKPVGDAVEGLVKTVIGGGPARPVGSGFGVDLSVLATCASTLLGHAEDIDSYGSSFRTVIAGLDLGNPADAFGQIATAVGEKVGTVVGIEVVRRLLDSFQGTATGLTQVAANLATHEDIHTQQLTGILASLGNSAPLSALTPLAPLNLASISPDLLARTTGSLLPVDALNPDNGRSGAGGGAGGGLLLPPGALLLPPTPPIGEPELPSATRPIGAEPEEVGEPRGTRRVTGGAEEEPSEGARRKAVGETGGEGEREGEPGMSGAGGVGSGARRGSANSGKVRTAVREQYYAKLAAGGEEDEEEEAPGEDPEDGEGVEHEEPELEV
ncbi:WXG100 family type VII secretion target [Kitasatospora sp. NPDC006697]|uniref:WXG100 family type VII secretion target n=1 Tax=Kitasatospora sp. NPDC006697 TaxID=3364020 RepID=UPI003691CD8A